MSQPATSTTPDPEMTMPFNKSSNDAGAQEEATSVNGGNPRGEAAACPTGLNDSETIKQVERPGGGGAPGTGARPTSQGS
jgi:hypothetical protein